MQPLALRLLLDSSCKGVVPEKLLRKVEKLKESFWKVRASLVG